ncbi:MAG: hypothetical protein ABIH76_06235 [Candidatus Bathyarchaeota archaeon]
MRKTKTKDEKCRECGGEINKIGHEVVCTKCGLVVQTVLHMDKDEHMKINIVAHRK